MEQLDKCAKPLIIGSPLWRKALDATPSVLAVAKKYPAVLERTL
jgi:hypothetical protein